MALIIFFFNSTQFESTIPDLESTVNSSTLMFENDLPTIDHEAVAELYERQTMPATVQTPPPPPPPSQPPVCATPVAIQSSPVVNSPVVEVSDELIKTCVTPRKVRRVQETLNKATQRHMCALKLLRYFFSNDELTNGNTDGSHNKECLDTTKLNSLKGKNHDIYQPFTRQ